MNITANVEISVTFPEGSKITVEDAEDRLYDILYEALCMRAEPSIDFWIDSVTER